MIVGGRTILDLPNQRKTQVDIKNNWLHTSSTDSLDNSEEEADIVDTDASPTIPPDNDYSKATTSKPTQDRWDRMENDIQTVRVEQLRQGSVLDNVQMIMQHMMRNFPPSLLLSDTLDDFLSHFLTKILGTMFI